MLDKRLQRIGVSKVVAAESGQRALEILEDDADDLNLVLSDLQLPNMTGI